MGSFTLQQRKSSAEVRVANKATDAFAIDCLRILRVGCDHLQGKALGTESPVHEMGFIRAKVRPFGSAARAILRC